MILSLGRPAHLVPWLLLVATGTAAQTQEPVDTASRAVPGISAPDPFPNGCVDCHASYPDRDLDVRLSTFLARWRQGIEPRLLAMAQAVSPVGVELQGRHPDAADSLASIPDACSSCHEQDPERAPPFAPLLHAIHLTGGSQNHFISEFNGECTFCHKLDQETGRWSIPSAPEPEP